MSFVDEGLVRNVDINKIEQLVANINTKFAALREKIERCNHQTADFQQHDVIRESQVSTLQKSLQQPQNEHEEHDLLSSPFGNLPTVASKNLTKSCDTTYWSERELFVAASDLCMCINGGVNYRSLCLQYQSVMEMLLKMLRSDVAMMRCFELEAEGVLEKLSDAFPETITNINKLFGEVEVLTPNNQNNSNDKDSNYYCNSNKGNNNTDNETGKSTNVTGLIDTKMSAVGDSANKEYLLPATLSVTDELNVNNVSCKEKQAACDPKYLDITSLPLQQYETSEAGTNINATSNLPHRVGCIDVNDEFLSQPNIFLHYAERSNEVDNSAVSILCNKCRGSSVGLKTNSSSSLAKNDNKITTTTTTTNNNKNNNNNNFSSVKFQNEGSLLCLFEDMYNNVYSGNGMEMLEALLQFVFFKQYEQGDSAKGKESFKEFQRAVRDFVSSLLDNYEIFAASIKNNTSFYFEYIVSCLRHHVKPNKRLLEVLHGITDRCKITSLVVMNMQLDNSDIKVLAPLLLRLDNLSFIDLSKNNIRNDGIQELCFQLQYHSSVESIDVSNNFFTNAGGEALLQLATTSKNIKFIKFDGVNLCLRLCKKLQKKLQQNRSIFSSLIATSNVFTVTTNNDSVTFNNDDDHNYECEYKYNDNWDKKDERYDFGYNTQCDNESNNNKDGKNIKNNNANDSLGKYISKNQIALVNDSVDGIRQKIKRPYSNYGKYFKVKHSLANSSLRSVVKGVRLPYLTAKRGKSAGERPNDGNIFK